MNELPVTVIIPTWNRAKMLGRALDSVFRQSAPCSEVLVIDDGSTDETGELLLEIGRKYPQLKVISQENAGPAAARNRGILAAENNYLAFLDSDDHWCRKKLEKQFAALSKSDYLISHTKEKWLRRGRHLNQKKIHIPRHGWIFDHCLQLCAVGMSTVMVRREIFERVGFFEESFRCCEDYDLWLRVSSQFPLLLIDEPLTIKEGGREDQVSWQYRVGMDELRIRSIIETLARGGLDTTQETLAKRELVRKLRIFGRGCLKHGRTELAEYYLQMIPRYAELSPLSVS